MIRFIPKLAKLRTTASTIKQRKLVEMWGRTRKSFQQIKKEIKQITEIKHFRKNQPLRIISDASREGLGAVLQQKTEEAWRATHFASRFLTTFEQKYSIIELELLAVKWATQNFRMYVYGTHFEVVSDHKTLTSILKGNMANKTYSSRLTRWVDRLLPFQFTVTHSPDRAIGMADYLFRHPSPSNQNNQAKAKELWNYWFTINKIDCEKFCFR